MDFKSADARGSLGVAVVNGKIYAIGGMNASSRPPADTNEEYDPSTDTWTFKAPMPTPRYSFATAVYQNKIYCIGGTTAVDNAQVASAANEAYDPATDKWEAKAPMPIPRESVEANVVDGKIYVVGGDSNATDAYDPATDSWTTKAQMSVIPYVIYGCSSAVVDNKIHVIGAGFHEIYDPSTGSWSSGAQPPLGAFKGAAGATTGVNAPKRVYVFGVARHEWGLDLPDFTSQSYDSKTNSWAVCASMPTGRVYLSVAVVDDMVFAIGGYTPIIGNNIIASAVNEQYTPIGYGTPDPSPSPTPSPSSTPSQEPTSTPEPKQPVSIPTIWIVAIAALVAVVILELIIIYFLKVKRTKSQ